MDKAGLLRSIAATGYNVGFGAKKHFATYDIVEKAPGWIGFTSTAVAILAFVYEPLSAKLPSAILAILGYCTVYINPYRSKTYDAEGRKLLKIFADLRDLYHEVQGGAPIEPSRARLKDLEAQFYEAGLSKQILFSDWLTHYKFFEQQQIDWIEEQLHFTWKDKVPMSFRVFCVTVIIASIIGAIVYARSG